MSHEEVIYGITIALSFISVCCSIFLWASILKLVKRFKQMETDGSGDKSRFVLLTIHVFWMAFSDAGFGLTFIAFYMPMLKDHDFWKKDDGSSGICTLLSLFSQFFQLCAFSWWAMICWVLWKVLNGDNYYRIQDTISMQKFAVFGISLGCVGLGILSHYWFDVEHYGDDFYVSCWSKTTRWFFYGVLTVYLLFAGGLLLWSWNKLYKISGTITPTMRRIRLYVGVFWLVWIFPLVERFVQVAGGSAPFWLVALHQWAMAFSGTANFLVWRFSRLFQRARSYTGHVRFSSSGAASTSLQKFQNGDHVYLLLGDEKAAHSRQVT